MLPVGHICHIIERSLQGLLRSAKQCSLQNSHFPAAKWFARYGLKAHPAMIACRSSVSKTSRLHSYAAAGFPTGMPGWPLDVPSQLSMSLDSIARSQRSDTTRFDKRPAHDRRPSGSLFNQPRGVSKHQHRHPHADR